MKVIMLTEPQNEVTMDRNVFKKVNRKEEERLSHFQDFPETIQIMFVILAWQIELNIYTYLIYIHTYIHGIWQSH